MAGPRSHDGGPPGFHLHGTCTGSCTPGFQQGDGFLGGDATGTGDRFNVMIKRRLPWLELWGPGGKLETAGCFRPPDLSALRDTPPRNQPAPPHGAGTRTPRPGPPGSGNGVERREGEGASKAVLAGARWPPRRWGAPGSAECTGTDTHRSHVCAHTHMRACAHRSRTHARTPTDTHVCTRR